MDQHLSAFITVADCRSFTRAAEILHTTQPAVSQNIQHLERRMNVKLLERTSKSVSLNKAGEIVYHYAKEILHLYEQMDKLVADLVNEASGVLSIGSSLTFGEYILPHALSHFLARFPNVKPNISIENTREVVDHVASGHLDIGIIEGSHSNTDVVVEAFAEDTVMIVASTNHPLVRDGADVRDRLTKTPWIVRELGSGTREVTEAVLSRFHINPAERMEFGSSQVIKEAVEAGLGVTVLSKWVIRKELALGSLTEIRLSNDPIHRRFSIVTRKSAFHTKSQQLFANFLKQNTDTFMSMR